jgi:hypothetical protein
VLLAVASALRVSVTEAVRLALAVRDADDETVPVALLVPLLVPLPLLEAESAAVTLLLGLAVGETLPVADSEAEAVDDALIEAEPLAVIEGDAVREAEAAEHGNNSKKHERRERGSGRWALCSYGMVSLGCQQSDVWIGWHAHFNDGEPPQRDTRPRRPKQWRPQAKNCMRLPPRRVRQSAQAPTLQNAAGRRRPPNMPPNSQV